VSRRRRSEGGPETAVLLVEGPDDFNVFLHLMHRHGIPSCCTIEEWNGVEDVLGSLVTRLRLANEPRLGVVIDADPVGDARDAVTLRWLQISEILRKVGYQTFPEHPVPEGTILRESGKPDFGVWIMPNNELPGMVENFVGSLVPDADKPRKLWKRAAETVHGIPVDERLFRPTDVNKATIHTWLAWQEEPGIPMGLAIRKGFLNPHASPAMSLISWLRALFAPDAP
jgi:Protein of unknown function (DUF3226)